MCITEPSNDDYDNDVSDNCDNIFGTFDDFGVKNDQKVSHNMTTWWKKRVNKFGQGSPPFFSGNARKKTFFRRPKKLYNLPELGGEGRDVFPINQRMFPTLSSNWIFCWLVG